jgi:hypothetical protein
MKNVANIYKKIVSRMKHLKLFEQFLNEASITDPEILKKMSHFHDLQKKIVSIEAELEGFKSEFKEFEVQIKPILDAMKQANEKLATADEYIVKITRYGGERRDTSYKDAYNLALSKVNAATKKVLEEALEASKKITNMKHSFTIDKKVPLTEASVFSRFLDSLKTLVKKFLGVFKVEIAKIDDGVKELAKLAKA